jgi:hypothetical protein
MLARETVFSALRVLAKKRLKRIETLLQRMLFAEAAGVDVAVDPRPERRLRRRGARSRALRPREAPDDPTRWRATFALPKRVAARRVVPGANAANPFAGADRNDLAPMARRLEAIRRVLADLPRAARRWARHLGSLVFGDERVRRTRTARDKYWAEDAALGWARYAHHLRGLRCDTS